MYRVFKFIAVANRKKEKYYSYIVTTRLQSYRVPEPSVIDSASTCATFSKYQVVVSRLELDLVEDLFEGGCKWEYAIKCPTE